MKGRLKLHIARAIKLLSAVSLIVVLVVISRHLALQWKKKPDVPLETKDIAPYRVELREKVQHSEYKEARGTIQVRADKHYAGEDNRYHLEGGVEIVDFGRTGGVRFQVFGDRVVYDKEMNRFAVEGNVRAKYKDMTMESDFLDYDRLTETVKGKRKAGFTSPKISGTSGEITYFLQEEKILLEENVRLEIKVGEREPLEMKGDRLVYHRAAKRGTAGGSVNLSSGRNQASAGDVEFELTRTEDNFRFIRLRGGVKARLFEEAGSVDRIQDDLLPFFRHREREIEAEEVTVEAFLEEPKVHALRMKGDISLKFLSSSGSDSRIQAEFLDVIFNRDGSLRELLAFHRVRLKESDERGEDMRILTGEEMVIRERPGILRIKGGEESEARMMTKESEIQSEVITLFLRRKDMAAGDGVKVLLRPFETSSGSVGFFSEKQPVFITSRRMRYSDEEKRFYFMGDTRMWQEKEMLFAQEVVVSDETGEMFCAGEIKTVFFHKPPGKEAEERLAIHSDMMSFQPAEKLVSFQDQCSLKTTDVHLTSRSIVVDLKGEGGRIKDITARGDVRLVHRLREGTGEEAEYKVDEERISLTGNPVLMDKHRGKIEGDKLTLFLGDGRIVVENTERERSVTVIKS